MRLKPLMFGAHYIYHHVWRSRTHHFAPKAFRTVIALYSTYCYSFVAETKDLLCETGSESLYKMFISFNPQSFKHNRPHLVPKLRMSARIDPISNTPYTFTTCTGTISSTKY